MFKDMLFTILCLFIETEFFYNYSGNAGDAYLCFGINSCSTCNKFNSTIAADYCAVIGHQNDGKSSLKISFFGFV